MTRFMPMPYLLVAACLLLPAGWAGDGEEVEPPEDKATVEFTTGYQGSSSDDALFRVAEFDVVEPNPIVGFRWTTSPYDDNRFGLSFERIGADYSKAALQLDLKRAVTVDARLSGFVHRLDNDPVSNLQAISDIKVVRSSDLDLGIDYQIRNRIFDVGTTFRHPDVPGLRFNVGVRELQRHGNRQILTTSHCTACHTTAQGREVDQRTTDLVAGVTYDAPEWSVEYELLSRTFAEDGALTEAPFEKALRPAPPGWTPSELNEEGLYDPANVPLDTVEPFNDRVWFQNASIAVDLVPEVRRIRHLLKAKNRFPGSSKLNFTVVQSSTENRSTGLEYDFTAFRGAYYARLGPRLRLNVFAHHDQLDNDELTVDLLALNGLDSAPRSGYGSPTVPRTYSEWRQLDGVPASLANPSIQFEWFQRASAMNRTVDRLGANLVWRPVRHGTLNVGYRYRQIDRDNVVLADGTGETTLHALKVAWSQRLRKGLRFRGNFEWRDTDNPYVHVDGGLRRFVEDPDNPGAGLGIINTPKSPASLQYYELHEFRVANLSNLPSEELRARGSLTWTPAGKPFSLSANVRYRDAENDELDYTDWQQSNLGVGVNLAVIAGPAFAFNIGLDHFKQETDAVALIPLMDG